MDAKEAQELTGEHSKRIQAVYRKIEFFAKTGLSSAQLTCGEVNEEEIEVLTSKGFKVSYEYAKEDGMQFVLIQW